MEERVATLWKMTVLTALERAVDSLKQWQISQTVLEESYPELTASQDQLKQIHRSLSAITTLVLPPEEEEIIKAERSYRKKKGRWSLTVEHNAFPTVKVGPRKKGNS
jgi:hypothetical protein